MSEELRAAVLAEARTWIGTPFHHEARVKGAGVDCLMLLAEVYERAGVIEHVDVPHYPPDWFLHQSWERYLEGVMQRAREIDGPPRPADVALFKWGKCFAHGVIVVEWPTRVIHAYFPARIVLESSAKQPPLCNKPVRFFSPFLD